MFTGVAVVGWTRWITSDYFKPIGTGPDHISTERLVFLHGLEMVLAAISLRLAWRYLLRPLVRARSLTLEGMMIVGFFIAWFYDPLVNMTEKNVSYNHAFINMGSWAQYMPFWHQPPALDHPEPILVIGCCFIGWYMLGPVLIGTRVIKALLDRYPPLTTFGAFVVLFAMICVAEIVFVFVAAWAELLQFSAVDETWTLAAGSPYQNPLYDSVLAGLLFTSYAAFHYFRDERGRTFVERGVDQLRGPGWVRTTVSQFAITGFLVGCFVVVYMAPFQLFAASAEHNRHDVKSFLGGQDFERTSLRSPTE